MFDTYTDELLKLIIIRLLLESGCKSVKNIPITYLAHQLRKFILKMGKEMRKVAELENCYEPNVNHVSKAFRNFNMNWEELDNFMGEVPTEFTEKGTSNLLDDSNSYGPDKEKLVKLVPTFKCPLKEHSVSTKYSVPEPFVAIENEQKINQQYESGTSSICLSPISVTDKVRKPKLEKLTSPINLKTSDKENYNKYSTLSIQDNKFQPKGTFYESYYGEELGHDGSGEYIRNGVTYKQESADTTFKLSNPNMMKVESPENFDESTKQELSMEVKSELSCEETQLIKSQDFDSKQISKRPDEFHEISIKSDEYINSNEIETYETSLVEENFNENKNFKESYERDETCGYENRQSYTVIEGVIYIDDEDNPQNNPESKNNNDNDNKARKRQIDPNITEDDFFEEFSKDIPPDDAFHESSDDDFLYSDEEIEKYGDCDSIPGKGRDKHYLNEINPTNDKTIIDKCPQEDKAISVCNLLQNDIVTISTNEKEIIEIPPVSEEFEETEHSILNVKKRTNINQTSEIDFKPEIKISTHSQDKDIVLCDVSKTSTDEKEIIEILSDSEEFGDREHNTTKVEKATNINKTSDIDFIHQIKKINTDSQDNSCDLSQHDSATTSTGEKENMEILSASEEFEETKHNTTNEEKGTNINRTSDIDINHQNKKINAHSQEEAISLYNLSQNVTTSTDQKETMEILSDSEELEDSEDNITHVGKATNINQAPDIDFNHQIKKTNTLSQDETISLCDFSQNNAAATSIDEYEIIEIISDSETEVDDTEDNMPHKEKVTNTIPTSDITLNHQIRKINTATCIEEEGEEEGEDEEEGEEEYKRSCLQDLTQLDAYNRSSKSRKCKITAREKTKRQLEEELKTTEIDLREAVNYQIELDDGNQDPKNTGMRIRASAKLIEELETKEAKELKYLDETGRFVWICPVCKCLQDEYPMVCCDLCNNWFHFSCVRFNNHSTNEDWFCSKCFPVAKKRKRN